MHIPISEKNSIYRIFVLTTTDTLFKIDYSGFRVSWGLIMAGYISYHMDKVKQKRERTLHVITRTLHPSNRLHENSMVSCSCFDGLKSVGVFVGRLSEVKYKISKKFLDTYSKIVYT